LARRKVNVPDFIHEDPKHKKARKTAKRNYRRVYFISICFAIVILAIVLLFTAFGNDNHVLVGWGEISIGIISLLSGVFLVFVEIKRWDTYHTCYCDYIEGVEPYMPESQRKKDLAESREATVVRLIILLIFAIIIIVCGIRRLRGLD
jgi:hypothetical protein